MAIQTKPRPQLKAGTKELAIDQGQGPMAYSSLEPFGRHFIIWYFIGRQFLGEHFLEQALFEDHLSIVSMSFFGMHFFQAFFSSKKCIKVYLYTEVAKKAEIIGRFRYSKLGKSTW